LTTIKLLITLVNILRRKHAFLGQPELIILNNRVDLLDDGVNGLFILDVQGNILDHVEVVNDFDYSLVELIVLRAEELIHT